MDNNPFAPPVAIVADVVQSDLENEATPFFAVSVLKLFVLSVCTFGLYKVYWFYKNWRLIKEHEQSDIRPVARAILSVFFCYQCFKRIRDFDAPASIDGPIAPGRLAAGLIITTLLQILPDPFWPASIFSVVFLIPAQIRVNQINSATRPNHHPNRHFSIWNWVVIVLGLVWLLLIIIGFSISRGR
jgi:hypothetical protein